MYNVYIINLDYNITIKQCTTIINNKLKKKKNHANLTYKIPLPPPPPNILQPPNDLLPHPPSNPLNDPPKNNVPPLMRGLNALLQNVQVDSAAFQVRSATKVTAQAAR